MAEATYELAFTAKQLRTMNEILRARARDLRQQAVIATNTGKQEEAVRIRAAAAEVTALALRFEQ